MIEFKTGNLLDSMCQVLVNAVNCVGVMETDIALEFKQKYPAIFNAYKKLCQDHLLVPGDVWFYNIQSRDLFGNDTKRIMCFATKGDWRNKSRLIWIEQGLKQFVKIYKKEHIDSIAFPKLGCNNGGLDWETEVKPLMIKYLEPLKDIKIEIYE